MKNYLTHLRNIGQESRLRAVSMALALVAMSSLAVAGGITAVSAQTGNQAPVAVDDSYATTSGLPILIGAPGLLSNDTDADGDPLTVFSSTQIEPAVSNPGALIVGEDGSFFFEPAEGFTGTATFTYLAGDHTDRDDPNTGLASEDPATVTIQVLPPNSAPVADSGGPYIVASGDSVVLDASASFDPDSDPLEFFWNLDDDGFFNGQNDAQGAAVNFNTVGLPAPAVYNVSVLVEDPFGGQAVATTTVSVTSDIPLAQVRDFNVDEGTNITPRIIFADSTPDDVHAATIDWGDGTQADHLGQVNSPIDTSHTYTQDGVYTIQVAVTDLAGNVAVDDATVTVRNLAPVVTVGEDVEIEQGTTLELSGASFTDAGVDDTHSASIFWGEGVSEAATIDGSAITGSHQYNSLGTFLVTVSVVDEAGDSGVDRFNVTVVEPPEEPTPTPEPTQEPEPTPTPEPTQEPNATPTPTPTPEPEPTATPTPEPTATPEPTPEPTPVPTQGAPEEPPEEEEPGEEEIIEQIIQTFQELIEALIAWLQALFGGE